MFMHSINLCCGSNVLVNSFVTNIINRSTSKYCLMSVYWGVDSSSLVTSPSSGPPHELRWQLGFTITSLKKLLLPNALITFLALCRDYIFLMCLFFNFNIAVDIFRFGSWYKEINQYIDSQLKYSFRIKIFRF